MPYIIDAVNSGATVGEVCNIWRKVYGCLLYTSRCV